MQLTKETNANIALIDAFDNHGVKSRGALYQAPIVITPAGVTPWPAQNIESLSFDTDLKPNLEHTEILLVGTGDTMHWLAPEVLTTIQAQGIGVEIMTTEAACRTYNVLAHDLRAVTALLWLEAEVNE